MNVYNQGKYANEDAHPGTHGFIRWQGGAKVFHLYRIATVCS